MKFTFVLIGILCLLCLFNQGNTALDAQQTASIQIEQPYLDPNWRPEAGTSLTFEIRVTVPADFTSGTLIAELQNVTSYEGDAGNSRCTDPGSPDLIMYKTTSQNADWSISGSTLTYALSTNAIQTMSLIVSCYDYAAYGELKLTASGSGYTSNEVVIKIPKDNNGNKIADGWRNDGTVNYGQDDDNDSGPNSNTGDGITVINEYRGLYVSGTWTDTDPNAWDVFIRSDVGIGGAGALPMTIHEMGTYEVPFQLGYVYDYYIVSGEAIGRDEVGVRAIRLLGDPTLDPSCNTSGRLGEMGYGPPSYATSGCIYPNVINTTITRWKEGGRDVDIGAFTSGVIAHEIGHGVSLGHCPDFDSPNCYMWIPGDWPLAHVTQFASHHDQEYALTGSGRSGDSGASGYPPDRTYTPETGVCVRRPADVNGDCVVDLIDLLTVAANFGESGTTSDVNNDGTVDVLDLALVSEAMD